MSAEYFLEQSNRKRDKKDREIQRMSCYQNMHNLCNPYQMYFPISQLNYGIQQVPMIGVINNCLNEKIIYQSKDKNINELNYSNSNGLWYTNTLNPKVWTLIKRENTIIVLQSPYGEVLTLISSNIPNIWTQV